MSNDDVTASIDNSNAMKNPVVRRPSTGISLAFTHDPAAHDASAIDLRTSTAGVRLTLPVVRSELVYHSLNLSLSQLCCDTICIHLLACDTLCFCFICDHTPCFHLLCCNASCLFLFCSYTTTCDDSTTHRPSICCARTFLAVRIYLTAAAAIIVRADVQRRRHG
jgi:hypothetical protein